MVLQLEPWRVFSPSHFLPYHLPHSLAGHSQTPRCLFRPLFAPVPSHGNSSPSADTSSVVLSRVLLGCGTTEGADVQSPHLVRRRSRKQVTAVSPEKCREGWECGGGDAEEGATETVLGAGSC